MATAQRDDPYLHYNFLVEIDGIQRAGFQEAGNLTTDTDVIDYREGSDVNLNVRKLTGLRKYTALTLKRGYTQNKELWLWRKDIINGIVKRRSAEIILLDEARQPVLRWQVREAWISKWESGPFNAKTNEVTIESLELTHEGVALVD
jgi:phage tail-like protein